MTNLSAEELHHWTDRGDGDCTTCGMPSSSMCHYWNEEDEAREKK